MSMHPERRNQPPDSEGHMSIEEGNAIYVPCRDCEGDGCIGPNPAEDQCKRCGGSGCEPNGARCECAAVVLDGGHCSGCGKLVAVRYAKYEQHAPDERRKEASDG